MSPHRCLITGGLGYIGTALTERMRTIEPQSDICLFDIDCHDRRSSLPSDVVDLHWHGDILDRDNLEQAISAFAPTHVIHLAAVHYIPQCESDPALTHSVNVIGTRNVIEVAQKYPSVSRIVFASSGAVYASSQNYGDSALNCR